MAGGRENHGITKRDRLFPAVFVFCFAVAIGAMISFAGCADKEPPPPPPKPVPLDLKDIIIKVSTPAAVFTPTAVGIGEAPGVFTPLIAPGKTEEAKKAPPIKPTAPPGEAKKPRETKPVPPANTEPQEKIVKKPAEKTPPAPPAPPVKTPPPGMYTLQIGAYVMEENLTHEKEKTKALGLVPYVKEMKRSMNMYCVLVQEGVDEKKAKEIVDALGSKGFPARVLIGKTGYDAAAGVFFYEGDAKSLAEKVKKVEYNPSIVRKTVEVSLWGLRVGSYKTAEDACGDKQLLEKGGFSPVILKSDQ